MATSQHSAGSQTAVISTEHTLATITSAGVYQLLVDCNNLALGDEVKLRIYIKVRSGDGSLLLYETTVEDLPVNLISVSPPVAAVHEFKATLLQQAGTGRAFDWSILSLGGAPTEASSGSQTATLTTEHTLATLSAAKSHVVYVDTGNLAGGDALILRLKQKPRSSGTTRLSQWTGAHNAQAAPVKPVGPFTTVHESVVTLEQTIGTGRAYPWSVVAL